MNGGFSPLEGFLGRGRLRPRRRRHAPRRRHALADPDHPRRHRGLRRQGRARPGHRAARPGGRAPRDHDRRPTSGSPDKSAEAKAVFGADDNAHPGGALPARPRRRRSISAARSPASSRRCTTTSAAGATRPQRAARPLPQARLAPGRRLPDPQSDAPRAPGADLPRRPGGRGQPPDPPGRRHDQARRRRPLHPRALLRGGARPVSRQTTTLSPAAARHAHGRPARGGLARDHPHATTAAPT